MRILKKTEKAEMIKLCNPIVWKFFIISSLLPILYPIVPKRRKRERVCSSEVLFWIFLLMSPLLERKQPKEIIKT